MIVPADGAYCPFAGRVLRLPEGRDVGLLWVIFIFGRYLVGPKACVERGNFFLRLDWRLTGSDVLAGKDRLTSSNIGLAIDANTKEQAECYQRRLRRRWYPHAMAKDHCKAVHRGDPLWLLRFTASGCPIDCCRKPRFPGMAILPARLDIGADFWC